MKGSLIIVAFFVVGICLGRFGEVPEWLKGEQVALYALYVLMFLVGISVGSDRKALQALKQQQWKIVFVPLGTIVGTLAGVALVSMALVPDSDIIHFQVFLSPNTKGLNWGR